VIDRSTFSRIWHPEAGHDRGKAPYFEGWYVKLVGADRKFRMAVIPGLFRSADGSEEAFVQVLDGDSGRSWYVPYPASEYRAATDRFGAVVGPNQFSASRITLAIDEPDLQLVGEVAITDPLDRWPVTLRSPGAMGWYAYAPAMECYHGVVSFRHGLSGELRFNRTAVDLAGGRGYIEQDWGQAFPAAYVWMHSNHFSNPDTSLLASAALIPWWRGKFRGLLIGLRHGDDFRRFATYTGAKTEHFSIDDEHVRLTVKDRKDYWLELVAERRGGALLHAPVRTEMHRRVEETLDARIHLAFGRGGELFMEDTGEVAGLEVHGDIPTLLGTADR
jgi:tocopherol cyclase